MNLNRKFNEISKCIVTYVLHWTVRDEETHARVSKLGLELFYKRWNRCLTTMPKIILGENIV